MSDPVYCYPPDHKVLINHFGIRDQAKLDKVERMAVSARIKAGEIPKGKFDLAHLQAIHGYLFQDVYPFAGELRSVSLAKGTSHFMPADRIATGMADVHTRLVRQNYLKHSDPAEFAKAAGQIIGDVNYVHPFREGNGRTQLAYLDQLATQAGHDFDPSRLNPRAWIRASIAANDAKYDLMEREIARAIDPRSPAQDNGRER